MSLFIIENNLVAKVRIKNDKLKNDVKLLADRGLREKYRKCIK